MEDNTGRKWNIQSWFTGIAYLNIIPKYWKTTGKDGTLWEDGNKPRGKIELKNVVGIVITLETLKEELMYGRGICKNPEGVLILIICAKYSSIILFQRRPLLKVIVFL